MADLPVSGDLLRVIRTGDSTRAGHLRGPGGAADPDPDYHGGGTGRGEGEDLPGAADCRSSRVGRHRDIGYVGARRFVQKRRDIL